jgi:hypothetical protein
MFSDDLHQSNWSDEEWGPSYKYDFEWHVAEEGYEIQENALVSKADPPTLKKIKPLNSQGKNGKILFESFRDIDKKSSESIIAFVDEYGLLFADGYFPKLGPQGNSNTLSFFIREVRDFQEISYLKKILLDAEKSKSGSESGLKRYFDFYYERRFECDDKNFDSFDKNLSRSSYFWGTPPEEINAHPELWSDKKEMQRINDIHDLYYNTNGFPEKEELCELQKNLAIREEDPYYLNDLSAFYQRNGSGYPAPDCVTDLDFRDYSQKKIELDATQLGNYYLKKWLKFKCTRFNSSIDILPVEFEESFQEPVRRPQSLLAAIYLQFYDSLFANNQSVRFCPICQRYGLVDDELESCKWHHSQEEGNDFYYHEKCYKHVRRKLKNHGVAYKEMGGVSKLIELARARGYLGERILQKQKN